MLLLDFLQFLLKFLRFLFIINHFVNEFVKTTVLSL